MSFCDQERWKLIGTLKNAVWIVSMWTGTVLKEWLFTLTDMFKNYVKIDQDSFISEMQ